jgi:hypothetical protein
VRSPASYHIWRRRGRRRRRREKGRIGRDDVSPAYPCHFFNSNFMNQGV